MVGVFYKKLKYKYKYKHKYKDKDKYIFMTVNVLVPISVGELWDKYSILLIKNEKIKDAEKLKILSIEIEQLRELMNQYSFESDDLFIYLKDTNTILWDLEDKIRIKEKYKSFDEEFIELARKVYFTNDRRADVKRKINTHYNSLIQEVKDYVSYVN